MFQGSNEIILKNLERHHLEGVRQLRNDMSTWFNLTHPGFLDEIEQSRWFESLAGKKDRRYYVITTAQEDFLGIVRTDEIDWQNRSIRIGCDVVPGHRGKGIGKKTMATTIQYCFDHLNMHRIWLAVLEFNKIAYSVYRSCGFVEEGRYRSAVYREGDYHDYILMSILKPEYHK